MLKNFLNIFTSLKGIIPSINLSISLKINENIPTTDIENIEKH
jgi:hypothetical protein